MASDTEKKRQQVMGAYSGKAWQDKVKAMTEDQVVAIFLRLKSQNKI
jgi:hypothetical protein